MPEHAPRGRHHIHEPRALRWRRVFEYHSGQYKTRSRARRAIADGLLVQLRPLLHAEVLVYSRKHIALFKIKARQQGTLQLGQPFDDPVPLAGIPCVRSAVLLRPDQSVMARIECVAAEAGGDRFWAGAGPRGKVPGPGYMSGTSLGTAAGQVVLRAVASSRVRPSRRARAIGSM